MHAPQALPGAERVTDYPQDARSEGVPAAAQFSATCRSSVAWERQRRAASPPPAYALRA